MKYWHLTANHSSHILIIEWNINSPWMSSSLHLFIDKLHIEDTIRPFYWLSRYFKPYLLLYRMQTQSGNIMNRLLKSYTTRHIMMTGGTWGILLKSILIHYKEARVIKTRAFFIKKAISFKTFRIQHAIFPFLNSLNA